MMKHVCIILLLIGTLWAAQSTANQVSAEPREKFLGTWKLIPEPDKSSTNKIEPESDGGVKISSGCKQDGSCPSSIIAKYDGKLYKYSDYSEAAKREASFRKIADRTLHQDWYFNGKRDTTYEWQLSPDGNTLTIMSQVISRPESKKFASVYDRTGGPASNDDPFIGFWRRDWNKGDAVIITYARKGDALTFTDLMGVVHDRNCDGKDHTDSADLIGVLYSCRFPDDRTYELVATTNEKVLSTTTAKISEDGKKMVRTIKNAQGETTSEQTFEKIK